MGWEAPLLVDEGCFVDDVPLNGIVDFIISDGTHELLLETRARRALLPEDAEQWLLYLHQGGYRLRLLVNFGEKPLGIKRFVHTPPASRAQE